MLRRRTGLILALLSLSLGPARLALAQDEEMTFEPDEAPKPKKNEKPPADTTPPSKTLERAVRMYEPPAPQKPDYYSASIEFAKVISGETKDSAANKQRAEFYMGKTLFNLNYYAASLAYFDRIVQKGTGHRYYGATLKWLAALSRVLPETSGILEKIGSYDVADLDQPIMAEVRDELYYLLGRHYYRQAQFDQAIKLFQSVREDSPFYVKAKFFEGVTYVRQYKGAPAVDAFKQLLVIAEERPKYYSSDEIDEYQELAWLQLARVFYSTQQYDTSIKYYEKLDQRSPDWLPSLFEASWAYFMKTKNSKALGNIHTLNAPYFEDEFFPESMLLKAVIYYKYCQYDRALESVAEYNQTYRPLRDDLEKVLKQQEDNAAFYGYVRQIIDGNKASLPERTARLITTALADKTVGKTFNWVEELDKEIAMVGKANASWQTTSIATEVLQELNVQKSLAEADAGALARERIQRLSEELRELSRDGIKIKIETLNNKAGEISAKARGEQFSGSSQTEPIEVDDEHFTWRFNGEYWRDELGYYRFRIQSKCKTAGGGA